MNQNESKTSETDAAYEPSFCELVTNPDASDDNPQKHGYFVEVINRTSRCNKGRWYRCTDGNGRFWDCKRVIAFESTDAMRMADEHEALFEPGGLGNYA